MRTLKVGTLVTLPVAVNGWAVKPEWHTVQELEWTPKGRLIVRFGNDFCLTQRELEMNGAIYG